MRISDWSSDVCSTDLFKPGEMLNMFDGDANVIQTADEKIPTEYLGLHRFKHDGKDGARELVVQRMKEAGFLIPHVDKDGGAHDFEPRTIQTPDRKSTRLNSRP